MPLESPLPIHLADPHDGIVPHTYVVLERIQHCVCCGATHSWSELYAKTHLRPQMGFGKLISNLRHLVWPKYNLPIEQIRSTKVDRIPFCHECYKPSLAHSDVLPAPHTDPTKVVGLKVITTPTQSKPKTQLKTKAKSTPTIEDIMDML